MYIVIRNFCDLQDGNHLYREGDEFPRHGFKVSEERLNELATTNNATHTALIKKVIEPVHVEEKRGRKNARRTSEDIEELLHS